jgi:hypothetical protein
MNIDVEATDNVRDLKRMKNRYLTGVSRGKAAEKKFCVVLGLVFVAERRASFDPFVITHEVFFTSFARMSRVQTISSFLFAFVSFHSAH